MPLVYGRVTEVVEQPVTPTFGFLTIDIVPIHEHLLVLSMTKPFRQQTPGVTE